jgi:hypothetical protein
MKNHLICIVIAVLIGSLVFVIGYQKGKTNQYNRTMKILDKAIEREKEAQVKHDKILHETYVKRERLLGELKVMDENAIDLDILIKIESDGDADAISPAGARGLCQIMEPTWNECVKKMGKDWNYWECWNDPEKNKEIGWYYINRRIPQMLIYYNLWDNKQTRLACYNWGIGNVRYAIEQYGDDWLDSAPSETKVYIMKYRTLEPLRKE